MLVSLKSIYFAYTSENWILEDFSLDIEEGKKYWLSGKNGCGKSTLAWIIGGLQTPDYGRVELFDKLCFEAYPQLDEQSKYVDESAYKFARRSIASVFQDPADQVVTENVASDIAFGPQNLNWSVPEIDEVVITELEKAGLEHLADRDPSTLSGGEQQLVCIASAIAQKPKLLILDEPTAYLDSDNKAKFNRLVEIIDDDVAIIYITHDDISKTLKSLEKINL